MAGIGVRLTKFFSKGTIGASLAGFAYSTVTTVAPMFVVIGNIGLMQHFLDYSKVGYYDRELFACTILYTFIFSLLSAAPFNSVLSKYLSDIIYREQFEDILPCFYVGLLMNILLSALMGIPFCIWEHFVGKVALYYVFTGYCGYIGLVMTFYSMLYLSICKEYGKISGFFFTGMLTAFLLSLVFRFLLKWSITYSMLLALAIGFLTIAFLEMAIIRNYFRENSGQYRNVLSYFKQYWQLIFTNFFYTLGLYVHNFVFWTTDLHMVVAKSFVCTQPYDMATCLAMFTNITSSIIFIARTEMHFHGRYKAYSEAVIGGRFMDVRIAQQRMFRQLTEELMNLLRIQFIVTVAVYLLCVIFLPRLGFGGLIMRIYPCMAAGYFILYIMYAAILYLYYFDDLTGSMLTGIIFCGVTMLVSIIATHLPEIWYGIGVVVGTLAGWSFAYYRIRWIERNLDSHIFCKGRLLTPGEGEKPSSKVFDRYAMLNESKEKKEEIV